MGTFRGHFLPGAIFFVLGLWYCAKFSYRYFAKKRTKRITGCQKLSCNIDIIEGCAKLFFAILGIILEQVTSNGPNFHLVGPNKDYWDGNNWSHCTMYMFFMFAGAADILRQKAPEMTPKGINYFLMGLALFVEGYLFYFHTHGRGSMEIRLHNLLIVAIWTGAGSLFLVWFTEACLAEESDTNTHENEDKNGYNRLHSESYEETMLLDRAKSNHLSELNDETVHPEKTLPSMETQQLEKIVNEAFKQNTHSRTKSKCAVQITLQMVAAASMLLQGTWFVQIGSILYPPGKEAWSDTPNNIEFATIFFTWHLATIILFLAIVYYSLGVIMLRKVDRNRTSVQL